jgi:hypothetical protein
MPPRGLLTVIGTIDINQFWPASKGTASSDADTVHLKVDPATSFLHTSPSGTNPKRTTAYVGAYVLDHGKKKAVITSKSEIKIRLQGIDAPELHYPVIAKFQKGKFKNEFRQPYGAAATNALREYLKAQVGSGTTIHAVSSLTSIRHRKRSTRTDASSVTSSSGLETPRASTLGWLKMDGQSRCSTTR